VEVIVAINFCNGDLRVDQVINTFNAPSGTVFTDILGNSNFSTAIVSGQDILNLAWENNQDSPVRLMVYNALGKLVIDQRLDANAGRNTTTLEVSSWPAGTYFIQMANEQGFSWEGKVIKEG